MRKAAVWVIALACVVGVIAGAIAGTVVPSDTVSCRPHTRCGAPSSEAPPYLWGQAERVGFVAGDVALVLALGIGQVAAIREGRPE
jgi:hypothetical protein